MTSHRADPAPERDLLRQMLLIRRFEERLIELAEDGQVPGHYHVYIGQEATGVAVIDALIADDVIYTTHRSHGHLLARGAEPGRLLAEILGREGGYCHGRAGTLHLAVAELNVPVTSASVGGNVPQAVGAALTLSRTKPGAIAVCFFGDGTFEEGALYEALNMAGVWKLPILFVCENNGAPENQGVSGTFPSSVSAAERLTDLAAGFSIPSVQLNGTELGPQRDAVGGIVEEIRGGGGPRFIETGTVRWPGSKPIWPFMPAGPTRLEWLTGETPPPDEVRQWTEVGDPLRLAYVAAAAAGVIDPAGLRALDDEVRQTVADAARWALDSPFPAVPDAWDDPVVVGGA